MSCTASKIGGVMVEQTFKLHWLIYLKIVGHYLLAIVTFGVWLPVANYVSLHWYCFKQGIKNQRVYIREGILNRSFKDVSLVSQESITLNQTFWQRLIKIGDLTLTGQGNNQLTLIYLQDPIKVKAQIQTASRKKG